MVRAPWEGCGAPNEHIREAIKQMAGAGNEVEHSAQQPNLADNKRQWPPLIGWASLSRDPAT